MPRPAPVLFLALLLLLVATPPLRAFSASQTKGPATLHVRTEHDEPGVSLADLLHLTFTVEGSKSLEVEVPDALVDPQRWAVVRRDPPVTQTTEMGSVRWQQEFLIAAQAPGTHALKPTPLRYRDGTGWQEVVWEPISVTVETRLKEADVTDLRDITAIEELPPAPESSWSWLWGALAAGVVVASVLAWLVYQLRRPRPPGSAAGWAMRELARLERRELAKQGKSRAFAVLLTAIVRRYLEKRSGIPARRRTTRELLHEAADHLSASEQEYIAEILSTLESARYGAAPLTAEQCAAVVALTRQLFGSHQRK